jgi:hypothetical protein
MMAHGAQRLLAACPEVQDSAIRLASYTMTGYDQAAGRSRILLSSGFQPIWTGTRTGSTQVFTPRSGDQWPRIGGPSARDREPPNPYHENM